MFLVDWFLEGLLLTVNVIAFVVPIMTAVESYRMQRMRMAVWDDRAPWAGKLVGVIGAAITLALILAIEWAAYRVVGLPSWMMWFAG